MWGIRSYTINIDDIISIKRSYNPLSSPASSLKRLKITEEKNRLKIILISPVREQEFLSLLKEINPNIEIEVKDKQSALRFWDWDIN